MKRAMLIACCLVFGASMAFAQAGSVGVFSDVGATSCNFVDAGGLVTVYMSHVYTDGATASQFKLDVSAAGWTHLGDNWNFGTVIGTSISGVSVAYGTCLVGPIALGMANFFGSAAAACTYISIVADPASISGEIEGADCATPIPNKIYPTGGAGRVNSDQSCNCNVPVHDSTWGGIKALYQ